MTKIGVWTFWDFHENVLMCISKDLEFRASWLGKPKLLACPPYQTSGTAFIFAKSLLILQNNFLFFLWSKYYSYRCISVMWNSIDILNTHERSLKWHRGKFVDASTKSASICHLTVHLHLTGNKSSCILESSLFKKLFGTKYHAYATIITLDLKFFFGTLIEMTLVSL